MKKLTREEHKYITEHIKNMFLPMHEHFGSEKGIAKTVMIASVEKYMLAKGQLTKEEIKQPHFYKWFNSFINNKVHSCILHPESKHYLQGLCSELINGKAIFYYPITREEVTNIKATRRQRMKSAKKMYHLRYEIELPQYMNNIRDFLESHDEKTDVV